MAREKSRADEAHDPRPGSKRQRADARRRTARIRRWRRRATQGAVVAALLIALALWAFDGTGPSEIVEAEVIRTVRYKHFTQTGSHDHIRATLSIEGKTEHVIERADGYTRGQRVQVWIRRGRFSRRPYFDDIVKPGEIQSVVE